MDKVVAVLYFLLIVLEVILIFNLLIVVHELGHFLAARWRGLVVEQFAVWFGKPLWKRTYNGVVYSLGSIPFGGFVKLPQMAPMESIEGESETPRELLPPVTPLDKIIVAFAGPLFSMALAVVFAVVVWAVQRPLTQAELSTTVGYVLPDGPAAKALSDVPNVVGLQPGDEVLEVDNHPVSRFGGMNGSIVWYVARSEGEKIPFKVRRGGETLTFLPKIDPDAAAREGGWFHRRPLREVGILPAFDSIVGEVAPGSPAANAGLLKQDVITAVDGQEIHNPSVVEILELAAFNKPLALTVRRGTETLQKTLPAMPFRIGAVTPGGPADKEGGLRKDDVILAVNDEAPASLADFRATLTRHAGQAVTLKISRNNGNPQTVQVTPLVLKDQEQAAIGIVPDAADGISWVEGGRMKNVTESPGEQIATSVMSIVNTVGAVIAPKSSIKLQHLGGPVMIAQTYYNLLTSEHGWRLALWFSVVLNVNLALLNLLPVPLFDGGHILMGLIEMVRRKPISIRVLETIQVTCFVLVVGYMLYITSFDLVDLVSGGRSRRNVEFRTPAATPAPASPAK